MDPHVGCLTHTIDLWRAHTLCATQGWLWTPEGGAFDAAAADGHGKRLNDENLLYLRCVDCAFGYNVTRRIQMPSYIDDKFPAAITRGDYKPESRYSISFTITYVVLALKTGQRSSTWETTAARRAIKLQGDRRPGSGFSFLIGSATFADHLVRHLLATAGEVTYDHHVVRNAVTSPR